MRVALILKVLGTKGELPQSAPRHTKQSGFLIDGKLLLDVGDKRYLKKYDPKWVLISHLHPDHAYFVRRKSEEIPDTKAQIFAPEIAFKGMRLLKRKRKIGPYIVTPIPTHHGKYVYTQAYLIQKGKKSILYTSDLIWIDKKYHRLFKQVDLIILEASFINEGGMIRKDKETGKVYGHNGVPNLLRLFHSHSKKILFVHFGSWFIDNPRKGKKTLKAMGKEYGVEVIVGFDGKEIEI